MNGRRCGYEASSFVVALLQWTLLRSQDANVTKVGPETRTIGQGGSDTESKEPERWRKRRAMAFEGLQSEATLAQLVTKYEVHLKAWTIRATK